MIWLASFPRSGNTFFRNILYEVYGLESSEYHIMEEIPFDPDYTRYPFVKTHLLPSQVKPGDPDIKAVYLVRDGRDSMVSIAHQRKDLIDPGSDFYENMKAAILAEKGTFFGGWSKNASEWAERANLIIRYEDLVADPVGQVERLRAICKLPDPDPGRLPSFQAMKKGNAHYGARKDWGYSKKEAAEFASKSFRKGKSGSWKEEMPEDLFDLFWSLHGETMESFGYQFNGSTTSPDPDLDHIIMDKLGLPSPSRPGRKIRILMEADKVVLPDNDGVKRYQVDLLKGLAKVCENPHSRWQVDLFIRNNTYPIGDYRNLIFNPFKNSDLKREDHGRKKPKRSLIETFERAMVGLVPARFASWLHRNNIRIFHQTYIFFKKLVLGIFSLFFRTGSFFYGQLNLLYSNIRQLFIVPRSEKEFRTYDLIHLPLKQHYFPFRKTRTPILTTLHDLTHRYFPQFHTPVNISNAEKGLKFIKRSGSHVLAVSRSTMEDTRKELHLADEKLHLVYEASDRDKFHFEVNREDTAKIREKYGIPSDTSYFLCLSTLEPRKNIANTIRAFNALMKEHPDYPLALVIAGKKGWLTQQTLLQDQIYSERIVYTGFIDDDDLSSIYSEALALCYLSFYEGFGLPALESMSCGTPVLYGNNSSLPEVVGKGGIAVDPHDVKEISSKMKILYEDRELAGILRREALKQSLNFSWRKTLLNTLEVYEKVINFEKKSESR